MINRWGGSPGTATFRSVQGYEGWSIEAQLLLYLIDALAMVDYHQLKLAGVRSARMPQPQNRPWDRSNVLGSDAIPYDEIDEWMTSTWTN